MQQHYPENRIQLARKLRSQQTDAERLLWSRLRRRQLGVRFQRQRPIGRYIVDFYCPAAALVVEVDGGQHFLEAGRHADAIRDSFLNSRGLQVLRFDNRQVLTRIDDVVGCIYAAI